MRIKVCEFRARNIKENKMTYIEVEEEKGNFFYITIIVQKCLNNFTTE